MVVSSPAYTRVPTWFIILRVSSAVIGQIVTAFRSDTALQTFRNREHHNLYAFIVTGTITSGISRGHWFVIAERVITSAAIKRGARRAYTTTTRTTIELLSTVMRRPRAVGDRHSS